MPIGAFKLNGIGKATVTVVAQVLRAKNSVTAFNGAAISITQSKFGGSSAIFDETDNYLTVGVSNWNLTDFTFEGWFYITSELAYPELQPIFQTDDHLFYLTNYGLGTYGLGFDLYKYTGTGQGNKVSSADLNVTLNTWHHVAWVRSGSSVKVYFNGTEYQTGTYSTAITSATTLTIGKYTTNYFGSGYLDELRVSNTARYSANFTPSTTAFVNDSNTLLLIHANGTNASTFFEDDNGTGRTQIGITAIGNAQVDTAQSQFGGSSLLCDGTGDYLTCGSASDFNFGSSSFTIEFWIRFNVAPTLYVPIASRYSGSIFNGEWWCEITAAEKKMYWGFKNTAGTQYYVNLALAGTAFTTGTWYHIALVNNAGTAQMYVNGTATGATTALSGSFGNYSPLYIGALASTGYSLNGWIDEVRISGSARYTTNFTPSTTPFVNDSNTKFLCHMDGTDASTVFRDDNGTGRSQVGFQALGNAQIDTAQSKFGGSSALFDGTGDYLDSTSTFVTFGTGDFTIECWARTGVTQTNNGIFHLSPTGFSTSGTALNRGLALAFYNTSPYGWVIYGGNADWGAGVGTAHSTNTWYHLAMVRSSGTLKVYVNGTSLLSIADTTNYTAHRLVIGGYYSTGFLMNGWVDEFRVSNTARYTADFTAPTAPFQNDSNTLLLMHMDGTDASTVFTDDNGVYPA